ncbi:putative RNA-directed DNA polymerase (reverse transcriptase), Non LTR Retrotransposon protein [Pseudoloma neurophilia]|uniref:Putative RNA-directed DNA polymerase (Reverse transcriptase), Non LTR Retrotransposon protein n=1 Tax=Pseudoloma neurophilia TaxID=146866 RepID=A0A0R0LX04_9MICR|nr:putative RNA-directed DNA polymerase (reverse transcriptase), Non LTR Retrotransposon protein [Pseudoloma neurophilia]
MLLVKMSISNNILNATLDDRTVKTSLNRGLPQGNVISPLHFNAFITDLFNEIDVGNKSSQLLAFADDLLFISDSEKIAQDFCDRLNNYCQKNGLILNSHKSFYISKYPCVLSINKIPLLQKSRFKYLGYAFDVDGLLERQNLSLISQRVKIYEKNIKKFCKNNPNTTTNFKISAIKMFLLPLFDRIHFLLDKPDDNHANLLYTKTV